MLCVYCTTLFTLKLPSLSRSTRLCIRMFCAPLWCSCCSLTLIVCTLCVDLQGAQTGIPAGHSADSVRKVCQGTEIYQCTRYILHTGVLMANPTVLRNSCYYVRNLCNIYRLNTFVHAWTNLVTFCLCTSTLPPL